MPTPVPMEAPDLSGLPSFEATDAAEEAQERISLDAFLQDARVDDAAPAFTITEDFGAGPSAEELAAATAAVDRALA